MKTHFWICAASCFLGFLGFSVSLAEDQLPELGPKPTDKQILQHFDENGDGRLDMLERRKALEAKKKMENEQLQTKKDANSADGRNGDAKESNKDSGGAKKKNDKKDDKKDVKGQDKKKSPNKDTSTDTERDSSKTKERKLPDDNDKKRERPAKFDFEKKPESKSKSSKKSEKGRGSTSKTTKSPFDRQEKTNPDSGKPSPFEAKKDQLSKRDAGTLSTDKKASERDKVGYHPAKSSRDDKPSKPKFSQSSGNQMASSKGHGNGGSKSSPPPRGAGKK